MTKEERMVEYRRKHFGESAIANCGMKMYIMAYRNNDDIDVVFQDGTIVTNKRYKNFTKGKIANPNLQLGLNLQKHIGEIKLSSYGQSMMIIACADRRAISVIFEDGTVVNNKYYGSFQLGKIKNPNFFMQRVGEVSSTTDGKLVTIIAYRGSNDIDVQFEDGLIVCHRTYNEFKNKQIKHRTSFVTPLGQVTTANNGQKMTIVVYRGANDVDVQFEDGTIVCHKQYASFLSGRIKNPNLEFNYLNNKVQETALSVCGQTMTIIACRGINDIDVQFEDGSILCNQRYSNFKEGKICPTGLVLSNCLNARKSKRVGLTNLAKNGMMMTIIDYRGAEDVDIEFEDGQKVFNKRYEDFKKGWIGHPAFKDKYNADKVGETNIANNGQKMTIIECISAVNLTIQFEDGTIVYNKRYSCFKNGIIRNPNFKRAKSINK